MTRATWLGAIALITVACTGATADSTTEPPLLPSQGRLVIVDGSGDIVVVDPDGSNRVAITDDAGESAVYSQPVWSPDARSIAWGQVSTDGFGLGVRDVETSESATFATSSLPFYLYWSPSSRNLGVLHNGENGLDFEMLDVDASELSVVDRGSPFYFSWSPSGDRVVTHVGPNRFEKLDTSGARESLEDTAAGYLSPFWTPAGIVHIANRGMLIESADGSRARIIDVGQFTTFVANAEGTRVAYQSVGGAPTQSVGLAEVQAAPDNALVVVEVQSRSTVIVSEDPALGFFWSPDGEKLLFFIPTTDGLRPHVWDTDGTTGQFEAFNPSIVLLREMFPFFPQYAQSLSYWSPGSDAFTYAADDGVWVQDLSGSDPEFVSTGSWVAWSR